MQDYERAVLRANIAACAGNYDDQCEFMRQRVEKGGPLSAEERDIFADAYKNALVGRREATRIAATIEAQERKAGNDDKAALAGGYKTRVQVRVLDLCEQATHLIESRLVASAEAGEPKAFYLRMLGDFYRYQVECGMIDDTTSERIWGRHAIARASAYEAYASGMQEAKQHLLPTHPVRLQLALNFAVFQQSILNEPQMAHETARSALAQAAGDLEHMPREAHDDAEPHLTTLVQFVKDLEKIIGPK